MRPVRLLLIALLPIVGAGCLFQANRPRWTNGIPLLNSPLEADAAYFEYVLVERTAGGDDINRRVWDRIDEQILPFESRTVLEATGLRVGIASESTPGPLRKMIEDPRTDRGHRYRTFGLDKPVPLGLSGALARAEFTIPAADGKTTRFAREAVGLGFDLTVRDAPEGKVIVQFVPHACYRQPNPLIPGEDGDRDQATDSFAGASFEVALNPTEYLVIGTDWYWEHTFGHLAFTGQKDEREVQRILVLRAGRTKPDHNGPTLSVGKGDRPGAPPLAAQAGAVRANGP